MAADLKRDLLFLLTTPDPLIIMNTITAMKRMIMSKHTLPPEPENPIPITELLIPRKGLNLIRNKSSKLLLKLLLKVLMPK